MKKEDAFENNKTDLVASVAKSAVGAVPFAGNLLSEVVGLIIPNQRIERLSKYVQELEKKLAQVSEDTINELSKDERFVDLIEEGFIQASRAITDERRKYIASIVKNGITDKSIKLEESKFLLKLLQELNDVEIIWLRFFKVPTLGGDEKFREKHKNVLEPVAAHSGSDKQTFQKEALQKSYKSHLERLGLIKHHIRIDSETKVPEFDKFTGQPKVSYSDTTTLGNMLLEQIDLVKDEQD